MNNKKVLFDIKIVDDGVVEIAAFDKGAISKKTTSLQHFLSTFGQSFSTFETPILPQNCRKIIKSSNSELYIFEYPASNRTIIYDGHKYDNVFIPRTLFTVKISTSGGRKQLVKNDIFVLDPLTPFGVNMPLYSWCFNNYSYFENSNSYICWGSNNATMDNILTGDSSGYGSFFNLYISSGFNNHLEPYNRLSGVSIDGNPRMLALVKHLQANKIFPMQCVVPMKETIASIISKFKEGKY